MRSGETNEAPLRMRSSSARHAIARGSVGFIPQIASGIRGRRRDYTSLFAIHLHCRHSYQSSVPSHKYLFPSCRNLRSLFLWSNTMVLSRPFSRSVSLLCLTLLTLATASNLSLDKRRTVCSAISLPRSTWWLSIRSKAPDGMWSM